MNIKHTQNSFMLKMALLYSIKSEDEILVTTGTRLLALIMTFPKLTKIIRPKTRRTPTKGIKMYCNSIRYLLLRNAKYWGNCIKNLSAEEAIDGLSTLNSLVDQWNNEGMMLYTSSNNVFNFVAGKGFILWKRRRF